MALKKTLKPPFNDKVIDESNIISRTWQDFFSDLTTILDPLGVEKSFNLLNNQSVAVPIEGLVFDSSKVRQAFIDFNIQRTTDLDELNESGLIKITYRPQVALWRLDIINDSTPDDTGVTFSINSEGRVLYTSTNYGTTTSVFKLSTRARVLSGRNTI